MADLYLIASGVRRAVAARQAGMKTIPAVLVVSGSPDVAFDAPLDQLYPPKDRIERFDPHGRYLRIETGMANPLTRVAVPAIEAIRLSARRARAFTRLADVTLQ